MRAAPKSPAPAARRLAVLLEGGGDPEEAAALIEEAGGRAAALAEARRQVAAVEALAGVPLRARAPDELRSLLDFLVRRDL